MRSYLNIYLISLEGNLICDLKLVLTFLDESHMLWIAGSARDRLATCRSSQDRPSRVEHLRIAQCVIFTFLIIL